MFVLLDESHARECDTPTHSVIRAVTTVKKKSAVNLKYLAPVKPLVSFDILKSSWSNVKQIFSDKTHNCKINLMLW